MKSSGPPSLTDESSSSMASMQLRESRFARGGPSPELEAWANVLMPKPHGNIGPSPQKGEKGSWGLGSHQHGGLLAKGYLLEKSL